VIGIPPVSPGAATPSSIYVDRVDLMVTFSVLAGMAASNQELFYVNYKGAVYQAILHYLEKNMKSSKTGRI
jgi:hypothetical protein